MYSAPPTVPQGLKPTSSLAIGGTAEAVPYPKPPMGYSNYENALKANSYFSSLFQKSSIMWYNCMLVAVPPMPCVLFGYTISRNCFPALISASVIWIVFWKCTLSSLVPCTSSNDPRKLPAALTMESS